MIVKIRHRRFRFRFVGRNELPRNWHGACDKDLRAKKKEIRVLRSLKGEYRLNVILHEFLHGGLPDAEEDVIEELANDGARFLWRLGYRPTSEKQP